ncbi:hypothetical protein BpHYR1_021616 [Brachionus plicatilis]|uniref:Uncharacterized protein n=1 Tax=Brachionus plicatilis TaxID=10195 RepID=A0A3M7PKH3_BRAPC|nr:hypothetical protein BpHYR1_021616 [Brachionus plicatilis]
MLFQINTFGADLPCFDLAFLLKKLTSTKYCYVFNSMTTDNIESRANSLGMVLYNLWVHIAQANANFSFLQTLSKTTESPYNAVDRFQPRISLILNFEKNWERSCPLL